MSAKRLKVFQAQLGFYDTVVAAPSQKAALAAWGAGASEFAKGFASVTTDPAAVDQALAHPGKVLKRPLGSKGAFKLEADRIAIPRSARPSAGASKAAKERKHRAVEKRKTAEREIEKARQQELREMKQLRQREAALEREKALVREKAQKRIARAHSRLAGGSGR
jgi:hypothetical protein